MENVLELKLTGPVQKALTTPAYCAYSEMRFKQRIKLNNKEMTAPGAQLLEERIKNYITEELKLKFPGSVVGKTMSSKNLALVFNCLQDRYGLDVKMPPEWFYKRSKASYVGATINAKADMLKALAYAVYFEQKGIFEDMVEEVKKTISMKGDAHYKMKVLIDEAGKGELESYFTSPVKDGFSGDRPLFNVILNFNGITAKGKGTSIVKARCNSCEVWLEKNSIPY